MNFLIAAIAFTLGNFLYQAATERNWETAFERSFFQLWAIGFLAIAELGSLSS